MFIVALPRTATTALDYLLAIDPQYRYQRRWEVADPVPPPDLATRVTTPAVSRPQPAGACSTLDR